MVVVGRRARLMIAMVRWCFRDRGELPFDLELWNKNLDFCLFGDKAESWRWQFGLTWGALLLDNLNLFQTFSQFKTEVKHANPFSTMSVASGYNELNACSINTHSNTTPLS